MTRAVAVVAALLALLMPSEALAWGPMTHIAFSASFLEQSLEALNPGLFALLMRHPLDFYYGNIAADMIVGKNMSSYLYHCHNWLNVYRLFDHVEGEAQRAFTYGYLAHLGADVVAHNHYVPLRRIESFEARMFGHAMSEVRFDQLVRERRDVTELFHGLEPGEMALNDELLGRIMFGTVFKSFGWNQRIFHGLMKLQRRERWERVTGFMGDVSRRPLEEAMLLHYEQLVHEILGALFEAPEANPLGHLDPRGLIALAVARELRRELRKLFEMGHLGDTQPAELRPIFEPFFERFVRGQPVGVPNLSELFEHVSPGNGKRPRGPLLLARVFKTARERSRDKASERRARRRSRSVDPPDLE